jgi:DNA-binding MarR family transcriptional regulator
MRLRQTSRRVSQIYDQALRPVSLTSLQFSLLVHLYARPGLTMRTMAALMVMDPTTLKRLLDPMVRRGLVETRTGEADAREKQVFITDAGKIGLEAGAARWRVATASVTEALGATEVAKLTGRLVKVLGTLNEGA